MVPQAKQLYEFGQFRLDPQERLLLRDGEPVALTPKAFDMLLVLVENGGRLLEKEELMRRLWPDSFVEEGNLAQNVSMLRRALGEGPEGQKFIETVPRRGYRFISRVTGVQRDAQLMVQEHSIADVVAEDTGFLEPSVEPADGAMQEASNSGSPLAPPCHTGPTA